MRSFILAAAAVGALAVPAAPAAAQYWGGGYRDYNEREVRQELRECRRELRRAERGYSDDYYHQPRGYAYGYRPPYRSYQPRYHPHQPPRYWDGYRWRYRY